MLGRVFSRMPAAMGRRAVQTALPRSMTVAATTVDARPSVVARYAHETKIKSTGDANETPEMVSIDLVEMMDEEIAVRTGEENQSPGWEIASAWLKQSGFKVSENKEGEVALTKKVGNATVTAKFNLYEEPNEEEAFDEEEQNAENGEENEENEQDLGVPPKVNIDVKVTYADRAGKAVKGEFVFHAIARSDNRLYGDELAVSEEADAPEDKMKAIDWWSLDDTTQDRVYDYLEAFGVGDELAHFAKQYSLHAKTQHELDFLKTWKGILAK